jgi:hypothetical protein
MIADQRRALRRIVVPTPPEEQAKWPEGQREGDIWEQQVGGETLYFSRDMNGDPRQLDMTKSSGYAERLEKAKSSAALLTKVAEEERKAKAAVIVRNEQRAYEEDLAKRTREREAAEEAVEAPAKVKADLREKATTAWAVHIAKWRVEAAKAQAERATGDKTFPIPPKPIMKDFFNYYCEGAEAAGLLGERGVGLRPDWKEILSAAPPPQPPEGWEAHEGQSFRFRGRKWKVLNGEPVLVPE